MYKVSLSALRFRKTDYQGGRLIVNPYEIMAKRLASTKRVVNIRQGEKLENVLSLIAQRQEALVNVVDESLLTIEDMGEFTYIHVQGEAGQRGMVFIGADVKAHQDTSKKRNLCGLIKEVGAEQAAQLLSRRSGYNLRHYGTIKTGGTIKIAGIDYYLLTQPSQASSITDMKTVRINGLDRQMAPLTERLFSGSGMGHETIWGYLFEIIQQGANSATA